jgi:hypothetical protein
MNFAVQKCWQAQEEAQVPTRFMNLFCTSHRPMNDWCQSAPDRRIRFDVTGIASFHVVRLSQEQDTQCMAVSGLGELNLYAPSCESFGFLERHRHPCFPTLSLSVFNSFGKKKNTGSGGVLHCTVSFLCVWMKILQYSKVLDPSKYHKQYFGP